MASNVSWLQEHDTSHVSKRLQVIILASEWESSKGGLTTINRKLAIQLAKFHHVKVTFFLPKCSDEDKKAAGSHGISILEAPRLPGFSKLDWLGFPPENLRIDVVVGYGVKLGRLAQIIRNTHKCKWVQVVHTDPEEIGMFKCYENPISTGEEKHHVEVELCEMADFVVGVGPKLAEAFRKYLSFCKRHQDVFEFIPGIFDEFCSVQPFPYKRETCRVLVFGHGDVEDFKLKGFDIAARSVAALSDTDLVFVGAPHGKHEEIVNCFLKCGFPAKRLRNKGYVSSQRDLEQLFYEVDLVLIPSRIGGFGLTGLEALSAGLPVIVSKNSGFGEALGRVAFGSSFVIDSEDPSAWTAAIKGIWNRDRKSQLDVAKAVRCSYGERYSWSEQCKHLIEKMFELFDGVPPKIKRGIIEKNQSGQPAGLDESVSFKPGSLTEDDVLLIAHELGPSWKMFGRVLKVPDFVIDKIEVNESDVTEKCYSVLIRWQEMYTYDATYDRLARALQHPTIGREDVAAKYCGLQLGLSSCAIPKRKRTIEKNEDNQEAARPSHVMKQIRQVYQKRERVILQIPWCKKFNFQIEDISTRLRMVAKETTLGTTTTKEAISVSNIFTPHEDCKQPLFVLIESKPGMGKTTLCQKLAYDWASKKYRGWESFPRIKVLLHLRCREIKSTLWDAIDEQILPSDTKPEEKELFYHFIKENPSKVLLVLDGLDEALPQNLEMYLKLVQGKQLPGCYIILTSDHEAGRKVRPFAHTLLEIVEFTTTDVECFIKEYFKHAEHSAEELISKVKLDKDLIELTQSPLNTLLLCVIFMDLEGILPSNISQLYTEIALFILRRYESENGLSSRGKDLLSVYKKELVILGRTALDSLRKGELYFEDPKGDIKETLSTKFGFLSIQSGDSKRVPVRYEFFHKTFQEFLSGYFLAFSIIDDVTNVRSVLTDPQTTDELFNVFKFMSGIVAKQSEGTAVSIVQNIASVVNETGRTSGEYDSYLWLAHHLINECKICPDDFYTKLVRTFGKSLVLDDMVVRHVFSRQEFIATFFEALTFNATVRKLKLLKWVFSAEATSLLAQALRENTSLSSLDLSSNFIDDEGANSLARALIVNTSLSFLDLSTNSISAEGANSLARALMVNGSLSFLDLSSNSIDNEGANSLAHALKVNSSISSLDLSFNSIGAEGANLLAHALRVNKSISSLYLSSNSIGADGAILLTHALRENSSISSLDLSSNLLGAEGAKLLANALKVNNSLSSLDLSSNSIGAKGASLLAQALIVNKSLSSLNLSDNSIGDEGVNSLAKALRENTSLSSLNLSANCIGDAEAISLAKVLRENCSLSSLDLSFNSIGDEGAHSFAEALRENSSVSSLDLSLNLISAEGAHSLSETRKLNYHL